jgi:ADP-ribose diphosphatase
MGVCLTVPMADAIGPWLRRDRRLAYANPWIEVYDDEVIQPDGEPGTYGVVHPKFLAVGIVALDEDGSVLLVGQHRYTLDLFSWGIPGGGVPFDEDPLDGAKRELAEETGATATSWHELARFTLSNSITDGRGMVFLARGLSDGERQLDGTEAGMETRRVPLDEALRSVDTSEIHDVFTQVGLLAAERYLLRSGDVGLHVGPGGHARDV